MVLSKYPDALSARGAPGGDAKRIAHPGFRGSLVGLPRGRFMAAAVRATFVRLLAAVASAQAASSFLRHLWQATHPHPSVPPRRTLRL